MKIKIHEILPGKAPALTAGLLLCLAGATGACSDSESYSDLLRDETKAVNWFLARQKVVNEVPEDSVFEVGPDAPFYKMDEEGNLYMQVLNTGTDERAVDGAKVFFLYSRQNILLMQQTNNLDVASTGNSNQLGSVGSTFFIFGNTMRPSSGQYGSGVQVPLKYFGYDSEVNLVVKSYVGFNSDQTTCTPYLMNVRYFKAVY